MQKWMRLTQIFDSGVTASKHWFIFRTKLYVYYLETIVTVLSVILFWFLRLLSLFLSNTLHIIWCNGRNKVYLQNMRILTCNLFIQYITIARCIFVYAKNWDVCFGYESDSITLISLCIHQKEFLCMSKDYLS